MISFYHDYLKYSTTFFISNTPIHIKILRVMAGSVERVTSNDGIDPCHDQALSAGAHPQCERAGDGWIACGR
jgi:hypothetical protein